MGIRLAVAKLLVAVGRRDEARASLKALGEKGETQVAAQALLLRGRIALEERDYEAALAASARAAETLAAGSPGRALARWRMARALEGMGKPAEAAAHYRWLAEHARDSQVREASAAGLARVSEKIRKKETVKTP